MKKRKKAVVAFVHEGLAWSGNTGELQKTSLWSRKRHTLHSDLFEQSFKVLFLWGGGLVQPGQHVPNIPERCTQCVSEGPRWGQILPCPDHSSIQAWLIMFHSQTHGFWCCVTGGNRKVKLELLCVKCMSVCLWVCDDIERWERTRCSQNYWWLL